MIQTLIKIKNNTAFIYRTLISRISTLYPRVGFFDRIILLKWHVAIYPHPFCKSVPWDIIGCAMLNC